MGKRLVLRYTSRLAFTHYELEKGEYLVNQKLNAYKKMVGTPVDLPQEFFRINRDIWQALTIKVGASFLTFSKSS